MRSFDEILTLAAERHGGREAVLAGGRKPLPPEELAAIPDPLWLAQMARWIFHAGLSWQVVDSRWPGIEAALHGFAIAPLAGMDGAGIEALLEDPRLIRSRPRIAAIRDNARFIQRISASEGAFARRIAGWPADEHAALIAWLAREGARLGGNSGQNVLRSMGKDTWLLTSDVVARLRAEGVITGGATSARAQRAIQGTFDTWRAQSGLGLNAVSHVLALSIDAKAANGK